MYNCRSKKLGYDLKTNDFTTEELENAKTKFTYMIQREALILLYLSEVLHPPNKCV